MESKLSVIGTFFAYRDWEGEFGESEMVWYVQCYRGYDLAARARWFAFAAANKESVAVYGVAYSDGSVRIDGTHNVGWHLQSDAKDFVYAPWHEAFRVQVQKTFVVTAPDNISPRS